MRALHHCNAGMIETKLIAARMILLQLISDGFLCAKSTAESCRMQKQRGVVAIQNAALSRSFLYGSDDRPTI